MYYNGVEMTVCAAESDCTGTQRCSAQVRSKTICRDGRMNTTDWWESDGEDLIFGSIRSPLERTGPRPFASNSCFASGDKRSLLRSVFEGL